MKPKIVAITGGIGSGKSTFAKLLSNLGYPLYISDDRAKDIMNKPEVVSKVQEIFQNQIVIEDGKLDRKKIAEIVFNSPEKLTSLNQLIHPLVKEDFNNWLLNHQNSPFIIKETALLFEIGADKNCDFVVLVTAPLETRINRVMKRDNKTREQIMEIVNKQWTDEMKISKSDFVVTNVNLHDLQESVKDLLKILKKNNILT